MHASNAAATPISTGRRFGHRAWGPDRVATYRWSSVSHMFSVGRKPSANYIETPPVVDLPDRSRCRRATLVARVRSTGTNWARCGLLTATGTVRQNSHLSNTHRYQLLDASYTAAQHFSSHGRGVRADSLSKELQTAFRLEAMAST